MASIVLVSLNNARKKARDSKRISDIRQVRIAMEFFYDKYGDYPSENSFSSCNSKSGTESCNGYIGDKDTDGDTDIDDALAEFITQTPADPLHDGANYYYYYDYNHCCNISGNGAIIHIQELETTQFKGYDECGDCGSEGGGVGSKDYIILFKK